LTYAAAGGEWKACPILLPRWWDGMGRAQSPIMPEGRLVVWPKCNFSKESCREGLSRLDIRRRCCRSRTEGGGGPVASTKVGWLRCNCSKEPCREGLSRLDFCRRCCRSRTKVVCCEGERRWCAVGANEGGENSACAACAANSSLRGKPEDATAGERASKKEHPTVKWRT
jgi:hypothetical protein